jgi:hypothetical protein
MTSRKRTLAACAFRRPDRIPRFDNFQDYTRDWEARFGPAESLVDLEIIVPDETPFPSRARRIREEAGWIYEVDGWGRTLRRRRDAFFVELLEAPIPAGADPDSVRFESPGLDARYAVRSRKEIERIKRERALFAKTGGPFLRTSFVRGETQFLLDIAGDPPLAATLAGKVADHLAAVGAEAVRRYALQETGVWIYDDMGYNDGPMFSPKSFERVLLPAFRRMIAAYKHAGARYVFLHSDGDIRPLLDMLVDAGIDGLNPLERRANMDPPAIRKRYPRLILAGGMDNSDALIRGPIERIRAQARELIDLGRDGGLVIGAHSISPEVPIEHFAAYHDTCLKYGDFTTR